MARKVIAGTYKFVDAPEKLTQFTSATNILFDDNNGTVVNYTTAPISGITTNKFVLAVDRPNETQRYLVYAFEDTTAAGGALSISKGWYWFNASSTSLDAISTPSVVFSDNCSINDELTTTQGNALFTTSPIQDQPTVTTTRVLYKGKKELTMAQFEALTNLDDAVDYDITDFPNGGITNAQMTAALGYSRLFGDGEIYVCSDNGTYTKGHTYQIKVEGGVKSWEDITSASGDLQNYVPKQSETTNGSKTYAQVTNENGAVSIRVFENSDADLQNLSITKDGVTINGKKPLTSVQPLYKHELVIPYSFSVGDSETVNGSVTYHYLSNTGTQITSASEINDNFLLSGGIGKNSESAALTWVINEKPSVPDKMFSVKFTSDNIRYNNIGLSSTGDALPGISGVLIAYHREEDGMFDQVYEIYQGTERWSSQAYRTLTFETAPSGELLTWLQANAVPQGGADSNTVLLFNVNVTKAGSSITVEAVNAATTGYITGTVGTITDTVTQLI